MSEESQPLTLQQRIAALNASHVRHNPDESPIALHPRPQLPAKRPIVKQKSINFPSEQNTTAIVRPGNLPNGPPPLPTRKQAPPLPARKSSQDTKPKPSTTHVEIDLPRVTAVRSTSEGRIKAPAWGDVVLPPLPDRTVQKKKSQPQVKPSVPTRVPSIPSFRAMTQQGTAPPPLPTRKASVDQMPRKLPPMSSMTQMSQIVKPVSRTPSHEPENGYAPASQTTKDLSFNSLKSGVTSITQRIGVKQPPPVPKSSRPDLSSIQSTKPQAKSQENSPPIERQCLICRDFSVPDQHATLFPRQNVSTLQNLAYQLTAPFTSLTDKARAIFVWLHLNIDYNVADFFNNNVKGSTPDSTLRSGLAVCEGYAALFTNLATYAGLESIVISGHGKGFGHSNLRPGDPLPPFDGNHAWNVVKIDNHEWKLIDPCWGAGHVQGRNMPYIRKFAPERFTQSNEEFGLTHYPNNQEHFFLPGGYRPSWEQYITTNPDFWPYDFERPTMFNNAKEDYSIEKQTVTPPNRKINVHQHGTVRFSFGLFCEHWTLDRHTGKGPPPVFILAVGGIDGRNKDHVPLQYLKGREVGGGGDMWWVDIPARELGAPGETLTLFAVTSFGNRTDVRGLTVEEFVKGKGRTAMGFIGVCAWELM